MYQLQVLRKASEYMQKSAAWYDEHQPGIGDRFLSEVISTFRLIEANPYTIRKDFQKHSGMPLCTIFLLWLFSK